MATEPLLGIGITLYLNGKVIGVATRVGKTYVLTTYILEAEEAYETLEGHDAELWHRRLGHLAYSSVRGIEAMID